MLYKYTIYSIYVEIMQFHVNIYRYLNSFNCFMVLHFCDFFLLGSQLIFVLYVPFKYYYKHCYSDKQCIQIHRFFSVFVKVYFQIKSLNWNCLVNGYVQFKNYEAVCQLVLPKGYGSLIVYYTCNMGIINLLNC